MTQGNQVGRPFGGHDACESRRFERIAFRCAMFAQSGDGLRGHQNARGSHGATRSRFFFARVNHANPALVVHVRELCHAEK
jgi:hypothetical protein